MAIWATIAMWTLYILTVMVTLLFAGAFDTTWRVIEAVSYLIVVTFLTFSALMYLVARQGAFERFRRHRRAARDELDRHFSDQHGPLTVLVPSYAEEPAIIRKTLWSAALQEYPSLRVVLLIDDNPVASSPAAAERLRETRGIAAELNSALAEPSRRFGDALLACEHEMLVAGSLPPSALLDLVDEYTAAVDWLRAMAAAKPREDHVDDFFVDEVILGLADDLESTALGLWI